MEEKLHNIQPRFVFKSVHSSNCYFITGETVVVLFTQQAITNKLFDVVFNRGYQGRFVWLGGDAWTGYTISKLSQEVAVKALGVRPKNEVVPAFDQYFMK